MQTHYVLCLVGRLRMALAIADEDREQLCNASERSVFA
jgi:hypothetical protein